MQPFGALVRIEQPFLRGLHRVGATAVWVSEGTGTWGPPLRVGTRSGDLVDRAARELENLSRDEVARRARAAGESWRH